MSNDQYVITTLLRAERDEAYAAIRNAWNTFIWASEEGNWAPLNDVLAEATQCLPPELRTPDMPPLVDRKTTEKMQKVREGHSKKREAGFDDILG